ncbi:DUF6894 family protein [Microvirga aerilata]|uniref:DUF6894 family protein n=2 Tax=Microvirga aerilata TaxID=670292 RepID=UPI003638A624
MSHDTQCGTANLPGLCVETLSYLDQRQSIDLAGIPTCSLAGLQNHQPEEDPVPCFYFDVREGTKLTVDDEGLEFDSLDAAESGAISAAADIWRDLLRGSDPRAVTVEVRNEHGQWVLTVSVAMESHRVEPQPVPPCACKNAPHNFA